MIPPVFPTCRASGAVTALLGTSPMRLYEFGLAPQGVTYPYAVWQIVAGAPENYIGDVPDIDSVTVQVDAYAKTAGTARAVAIALRDAIEPVAHVVAWRGESRDPETHNFRVSFDVDWYIER